MQQKQNVLAYARRMAKEVQSNMTWEATDYGGYWTATDRSQVARIDARAAAALEFFRQYAGADSFWTRRAKDVYEKEGDHQSLESGARALGELLLEWSRQVEAGMADIIGSRAWGEVGVASTDVMAQVRQLMQDRDAHPAAAIVLCGAALEIGLRAAVEAHDLALDERASLGSFTRLLRRKQLITQQDVKDLEQCADLRNLAAHGDFSGLSPERAGLMEQQTNILLRRLADLHA
ncbi:hypothetical protein D5S17_22160 [Pseudonocardiaceae bacterium YIM PH 21723]|nr:hypothetical protein D5S17_22160 [Pseudonocardiaceae bacterium YIM PH 21723]